MEVATKTVVSEKETPKVWISRKIPRKVIEWLLSFRDETQVFFFFYNKLTNGRYGFMFSHNLSPKEGEAIAKMVANHYKEWKRGNFVTHPVGLTEREIEFAKRGTKKLLQEMESRLSLLPKPWWRF